MINQLIMSDEKKLMENLKIIAVWVIILASLVILFQSAHWQTRQELAYDVVSAQLESSMYMMSVDQWAVEYNMRVDQGYQMDIRNACLALTDNYDDMRRCKALVCYHTWVPFTSCFIIS